MNECGSSKQQLMTLYKQLNYDVVSKIKEWKDNNVLLYQKIIDCCETTNGNLSDIADILDEYIVILSDCCRTINGNLTLILEGAEQICIECVHLPATTTTTEECEPGTTEEPDITTEEPTYTTSEPGPEECDQPTEFHDKGTFYPYMVEKFLGPDTGMVTLDFETYDIPDRFVVVFGGVAVIDTGYHGDPIFEPRLNAALALLGVAPVSVNASQIGQASFIKTTAEDHAFVFVYAPLRNTAFNFILSCPGPYTTTTSEEEEVTTTSEEMVATTTEEQTLTTTEPEVVTTTSEEQVPTTTGEPCLLDVEVLYPPQPEVTTTTEEPVTTTTEEPVTTTTEEPVTTTTEEPVTTTTEEPPIDAFIFEIESDAETIELPLHSNDDDGNVATYDAYVYWDYENYPHTSEHITTASASHTYSVAGTYVVVIEGTCQTFATRSKTDTATHPIAPKITRVLKWGNTADFRLLNFYGCVNLSALPAGKITGANSITTFENFLYFCRSFTDDISTREDLFYNCSQVTSFKYAFASSGITGMVPAKLFEKPAGALIFTGTFQSTGITGISDSVFTYCPDATNFDYTFYSCQSLGASNVFSNLLFYENTLATTFAQCFGNCRNITQTLNSAVNMFQRNTVATSFFYTFSDCRRMPGTIPVELFSANVEALTFQGTFYNCYSLDGDLPADLFVNNTKAYDFSETFRWTSPYGYGNKGVLKVPNGLFRNVATHPSSTATIVFYRTFIDCQYMEVEQYIFSIADAAEAYKRFDGKTVNFNGMFWLAQYHALGGAGSCFAPELWDGTKYKQLPGTPGGMTITNHALTFYFGNTGGYTQVYSNVADIPIDWK